MGDDDFLIIRGVAIGTLTQLSYLRLVSLYITLCLKLRRRVAALSHDVAGVRLLISRDLSLSRDERMPCPAAYHARSPIFLSTSHR